MLRPIERWFTERLDPLPQSPEVKAYVVGVLHKFSVSTEDDMSKESLVLAFSAAKQTGDFAKFQRLGDWSLWLMSYAPVVDHVVVVETMGRMSYDACHRILRRQWRIYEELADELPVLTRAVHRQVFRITP